MKLDELTVLYVEDDCTIRRPMTESLQMVFKRVISANDGEEGLYEYLHNNVDVVITDLSMPKSDGVKFIDDIRASNAVVPIIITTGYTEFKEAYQDVVHIYTLVKPFSIKDVMDIVRSVGDAIEENRSRHTAYDKLKVAQACAKRILKELKGDLKCEI